MINWMKSLPENFGAFVISVIVVGIFGAVLCYTMIHGAKDDPTLQSLIGALTTAFSMVVGYWIGSSSGSKQKDALLADHTQRLLSPPPPSPAPVVTVVTPAGVSP